MGSHGYYGKYGLNVEKHKSCATANSLNLSVSCTVNVISLNIIVN